MNLGLAEKNVLITGSTKGVGLATAKLFAEEGANPIIAGRDGVQTKQIAGMLKEKYAVDAVGISCDLSQKGHAEILFEECIRRKGHIDILINNAGIWPTSYVKDLEKSEFENTMYLNLEVPYILSRLAMNHMIDNKIQGKIVQVVSQAAFHGSTTGHAHYAASKAGLVGFMISQAREAAPYGININAIAPGIVRTPMTEQSLKEKERYYTDRIPMGRVAEPEEIAKGIIFLASSMADYYTGITLDASGGMLMR